MTNLTQVVCCSTHRNAAARTVAPQSVRGWALRARLVRQAANWRRLVAGVAVAWGLAVTLIKVLTGVFDPPPAHIAVPWTYLVAVGAVSVGATVAAAELTVGWAHRPLAEAIRDL